MSRAKPSERPSSLVARVLTAWESRACLKVATWPGPRIKPASAKTSALVKKLIAQAFGHRTGHAIPDEASLELLQSGKQLDNAVDVEAHRLDAPLEAEFRHRFQTSTCLRQLLAQFHDEACAHLLVAALYWLFVHTQEPVRSRALLARAEVGRFRVRQASRRLLLGQPPPGMIRVSVTPQAVAKRTAGRVGMGRGARFNPTPSLRACRVFQLLATGLMKRATQRAHWKMIQTLSAEFSAVALQEPLDTIQRKARLLRAPLADDCRRAWRAIRRVAIEAIRAADSSHRADAGSIPWEELCMKWQTSQEFNATRPDAIPGPWVVELPTPPKPTMSNEELWSWYHACLEAGTARRVT
jgi:hypothetical protein